MKKYLLSGIALGFAAALSATTALADITIAMAGPITGQYAAFGEQLKRGAEMAVADINAAGGVNGEQLVLEIGDDACDPKQAVAVANQMVSKGIKFMAGHFCSGSSIPASQVYAEEGILQISPRLDQPGVHRRVACGTPTAFAAVTMPRALSPATSWPRTTRARRSPSLTTSRPMAKASPMKPARHSTPPAKRRP